MQLNLLTPSVKKPRRKPVLKESAVQQSFFKWLSLQYSEVRAVTFSVPNDSRRDAKHGARLKAQGMTAGVSDIICLYPVKPYHGLVAEFKSPKKKLTDSQEQFMKRCQFLGYRTEVWYSLDEAIAGFNRYLQSDYSHTTHTVP